ncbi:hypothetical protein [Streptomyces sp. MI02-7b]|uniref:hypothetical protein n=1 Tax=Streptomyces sp. MI02-7b TaxID=462941 RepID=UPI0029ACE29A|nr:hypothetical protein [Streptomyces sp. MI02-7b]MDX3075910.1 hypothetical protein [Streptomyces sp. MI02-7b]
MSQRPGRPELCVVQATINRPDGGGASLIAFSTSVDGPNTPFARAPWQLSLVAGYIASLRRDSTPADVESFTKYLTGRATAAVPAAVTPYSYAPLHDRRVTCLIDLAFTPGAGTTGWPGVSLVVLEQDADGPNTWGRVQRRRGYLGVVSYALLEITAEQQHLADLARGGDEDATRLHSLAGEVRTWVTKIRKSAKADDTLTQAATVRRGIRRS